MELNLKELAKILNGRLEGDPNIVICGLATIETALDGALTFLSNGKYTQYIYSTQASAIIVNTDFIPKEKLKPALIYVEDSYTAFTSLLEVFNSYNSKKLGIEEPSFISPTATLGKNVYIGAFVYIGENAVIGNNVKIYPNSYIGDHVKIKNNTILYAGVKIYPLTQIGENCILHSGCVIGSDGFGFALMADSSYRKIPQTGNVILHDNVEIGANTTIDRATLKSTIIHNGVKMDNLVHIAHNVEIGDNTVVAGQTGIAGSTRIGERCVFAGQVGIVGHIELANGTIIGAKSGVPQTIKQENAQWSGIPILPHKETVRLNIMLKNLPEIIQKVRELDRAIEQIKQKLNG
jgi:UDP-3-O-[3-hydroxymyristoyl] glucosamine N-acyltransferase